MLYMSAWWAVIPFCIKICFCWWSTVCPSFHREITLRTRITYTFGYMLLHWNRFGESRIFFRILRAHQKLTFLVLDISCNVLWQVGHRGTMLLRVAPLRLIFLYLMWCNCNWSVLPHPWHFCQKGFVFLFFSNKARVFFHVSDLRKSA